MHLRKLKILISQQKRPSWGKPPWLTICRKPASLEYLSKFGGFYLNSQRMVLDYIHCIHFSFIFYQRSKTLSWLFGNIFYRNSWIHSWRQISCNFQTPLLNWLDPTVESNWEKFSDEYFIIKLNDDIAAVVISRKFILLRLLAAQLTVETNLLTVREKTDYS